MTRHDYWQCPQCRARYWTLYGREKYFCGECHTRCVKISLITFGKPDYKRHGAATAHIDIENPDGQPSYIRSFPQSEFEDPERLH